MRISGLLSLLLLLPVIGLEQRQHFLANSSPKQSAQKGFSSRDVNFSPASTLLQFWFVQVKHSRCQGVFLYVIPPLLITCKTPVCITRHEDARITETSIACYRNACDFVVAVISTIVIIIIIIRVRADGRIRGTEPPATLAALLLLYFLAPGGGRFSPLLHVCCEDINVAELGRGRMYATSNVTQ